jgi:fatty-acyl-CoA synthase
MPPRRRPANFGVGTWIERRARSAPDRLALIASDRSLTYSELAARVRRLANGLRRLGVEKGDRVGWVGPNHPAFLECLFATGSVGAALAPVNHRFEPEAIRAVLEETQPTVLVQHRTDPVSVPPSVHHRVQVAGRPGPALDFESLLSQSPEDPVQEAVGMEDPCLLPHTSGTTGRPKEVMLSHGNVTWNVVNFLSCAEFRSDDVTVAIAPFFRVGGTGVNVLPVLFVGGTVVVPTDPSAEEILKLIGRHRVTIGFGNPDMLEALARSARWPDADLSSLRFVITGGAPVPERLIRAYLERGVTLLQGYGLSEAGPLALLLDPESALQKVGSAGRPPLLVDVRIERANGAAAVPEQTGELLVRGPNVMAGYWNRPEATAEVLTSDGWLRTGDAARMDDEGYVWIVDRLADAFTTRGHRVYPGDVERVLGRHRAVSDAGVVGVLDPTRGEVGLAFVVPADEAPVTERDLIAFCEQHLAAHEVPGSVRFVDRLPRNSVGKLIRSDLRSLAQLHRT